MHTGTRDAEIGAAAERALLSALDRLAGDVRRVTVRFRRLRTHASCAVRVWCGDGRTLYVKKRRVSVHDAIGAAAQCMKHLLGRQLATRRARRRRHLSRSIGGAL